jgi:hypothetical protein
MNNFAFMAHPIEPHRDVARKFPALGRHPPGVIDYFSRCFPPVYLLHVGGICSEATGVDFGFDFGLPPGKAYACMAETMILALEGRYECYSRGRDVPLKRVDEMTHLAEKHGFCLSALWSFERALTDQEIDETKKRAHQARLR